MRYQGPDHVLLLALTASLGFIPNMYSVWTSIRSRRHQLPPSCNYFFYLLPVSSLNIPTLEVLFYTQFLYRREKDPMSIDKVTATAQRIFPFYLLQLPYGAELRLMS